MGTARPVKEWLLLPPALKEIDLRPYFTYSRGQLTLDAVAVSQLTGIQRKLLAGVLGSTDAVRRAGIRGLAEADPGTRAR